MKLFSILLIVTGVVMTAARMLAWVECKVRVSRVFYNDDGVELPGLLLQRAFSRPVFFPFEPSCGFDSQIICKEDETLIRPMDVPDIAGETSRIVLSLPGPSGWNLEAAKSQSETDKSENCF